MCKVSTYKKCMIKMKISAKHYYVNFNRTLYMELQYVPSIYPVYTSIAKAGRGVVSWKGFKSLSSKVKPNFVTIIYPSSIGQRRNH